LSERHKTIREKGERDRELEEKEHLQRRQNLEVKATNVTTFERIASNTVAKALKKSLLTTLLAIHNPVFNPENDFRPQMRKG